MLVVEEVDSLCPPYLRRSRSQLDLTHKRRIFHDLRLQGGLGTQEFSSETSKVCSLMGQGVLPSVGIPDIVTKVVKNRAGSWNCWSHL